MIAGRLISILHLHEPYTFGDREIACVELPAPKAGSPYKEGWEHAEFVTKEPLDVFIAAPRACCIRHQGRWQEAQS